MRNIILKYNQCGECLALWLGSSHCVVKVRSPSLAPDSSSANVHLGRQQGVAAIYLRNLKFRSQ